MKVKLRQDKLKEIHDLIMDAYYGYKTVNYIAVGDSLMSGAPYAPALQQQYKDQFGRLKIDVLFSATAGLTSQAWMDNSHGSTFARKSYLEANILGDGGEDSIIEVSLGTNDINTLGSLALKEQLKKLFKTIQKIGPKSKIIGKVPPNISISKCQELQSAYRQVTEECNVFFIDGFEAMIHALPRTGLNCVAYDATHPNDNGQLRLLHYVLQEVIPPSLFHLFNPIELSPLGTEPAIVNLAVLETGQYSDLGVDQADANWRRLDVVTVSPRTLMRLKHKGTNKSVLFKFGSTTTWIKMIPPMETNDPDVRLFEIPDWCTSIKVNITQDGAAYDLLGDVPELYNVFSATNWVMPSEKINVGLNIEI